MGDAVQEVFAGCDFVLGVGGAEQTYHVGGDALLERLLCDGKRWVVRAPVPLVHQLRVTGTHVWKAIGDQNDVLWPFDVDREQCVDGSLHTFGGWRFTGLVGDRLCVRGQKGKDVGEIVGDERYL